MVDKFHRAAKDGYLDILKNGNRKQMNEPDEDGCTPTMLAAQHGNLEALRTIITRGGDVDKSDLLGSTALHHAARMGHWNCVSFLVNFGVNIWKMDNDMHTALNVAALENRTDIVKILDMAQTEQEHKNPKVVRSLKEKAYKDSERHAAEYERLQDKASREMAKSKRKQESQVNGDFRAPTKNSLIDKITVRLKGKKAKEVASGSAFSDLAGTTRSKLQRDKSQDMTSPFEFNVSEMDQDGHRTKKSVRGTASKSSGQVLYTKTVEVDLDEPSGADPSARPALTNVFPDASISADSGLDSFDSGNPDEEAPGLFSRPNFGNLSFLSRFDHMANYRPDKADDVNGELENGWLERNGDDADDHIPNRNSSGADSSTLSSGSGNKPTDDTNELLDDDEDDTEYTPVIMFLEMCGLIHYAHLFLNGDVDMDALMRLTNQDFSDMGLPIGPRRKLMDAIQRRRVVLSEPTQLYDTQL